MKPSMQDVLVIGGGPIGSYTAKQLAIQGFKVTVLESRRKYGNPVCCAGIISTECASLLEISQLQPVAGFNSASVISPGGKKLSFSRPEIQAVVYDRGLVDHHMAEEARKYGARYLFGHKVTAVDTDNSGVTVHADGQAPLKGHMAIISTGFNPALTSRLGFGKVPDFAAGAQVTVETDGHDGLEVYLGSHIAPGFFAWFTPIDNNTALAGLLVRRKAPSCLASFLGHLRQTRKINPVSRPIYRGVSLSVLPRSVANRLLVLGDCAGQVKPLTGGGLYFGLKAAPLAVETARRAFEQGDFSARSLSSYHRSWHKLMGKSIRLGRLGRRVYEKFDDRRIDKGFSIIERESILQKLAGDLSISFDDHGRVIQRALTIPAFYRLLGQLLTP